MCEHFHLPVQSGSNRILKLMNRKYTQEEYLELTSYIRKQIPDASITTDIIVGFPSETDEDFRDTLTLVEKFDLTGHLRSSFPPRSRTAAARMKEQLPQGTKV